MSKRRTASLITFIILILFSLSLCYEFFKYKSHFDSKIHNDLYPYNTTSLFKLNFPITHMKVAIIDTGVNSDTESLKKSRIEYLSINKHQSKSDNEHGTAIADIIYNSDFLDSIDDKLRNALEIISIDVADNSGKISMDSLIKGIDKAIENKVDIINISLGVYKNTALLKQEINKAINHNIVIVASAGNDSTNQYMYPSSYDPVISVASTDPNRNYLINNNANDKIDISFAGEDIPTNIKNKEQQAGSLSGTSASTALMTSAVILLKEIKPKASPELIMRALKNTSIDIGKKGKDIYYGYGYLDLRSCAMFLKNRNFYYFSTYIN